MDNDRDTVYRHELARLTPGLRRFARALVRYHAVDTADDLVQATLTQALRGDTALRGTRLQTRLLSILVGMHRNLARSVGMDQTVGAASGGAQALDTAASWKAARRDPANLSSVPLEYRESLLLVALEGMSYAQVAECLGLSAAVVATRVARARDYLARAQAGWSSDQTAIVAGHAARPAGSHLRVVK